jgi:hypothetical protein
MSQTPKAQCIEYLVRLQHPNAPSVDAIAARLQAGMEVSQAERERSKKATAYRTKLEKMSSTRLQRLCAKYEEQQRFFNQASANADFDHWAKFDFWTVDQAIALVLGRAPNVVSVETMQPFGADSPFAKQYWRLHHLARVSIAAGRLSDRERPKQFVAWAKQKDIDVPATLAAALATKKERSPLSRKQGKQPTTTAGSTHATTKTISPTEFTTKHWRNVKGDGKKELGIFFRGKTRKRDEPIEARQFRRGGGRYDEAAILDHLRKSGRLSEFPFE